MASEMAITASTCRKEIPSLGDLSSDQYQQRIDVKICMKFLRIKEINHS
jgi:hypothetical protein